MRTCPDCGASFSGVEFCLNCNVRASAKEKRAAVDALHARIRELEALLDTALAYIPEIGDGQCMCGIGEENYNGCEMHRFQDDAREALSRNEAQAKGVDGGE